MDSSKSLPPPSTDWLTQRQLAELLGISERTASVWASTGRLAVYEHGVPAGGRRQYSRALVERELQRRWDAATEKQDQS